jgi:dUTP pyrophosphatase
MEVPILRLRESAREPTYATPGSVGFDVCTAEAADIEPGAIELVGTGLVVATPPGWALLVCLRSSTPKRFGVMQPHGIGVIDQDYRWNVDELRLQLLNFTNTAVHIPADSRIAQGLFVHAEQAVWTAHVPGGENRGGFGSTED